MDRIKAIKPVVGRNPKPVEFVFTDASDDIIAQAGRIKGIVNIVVELIHLPVKLVQTAAVGAHPDNPPAVLIDSGNQIVTQGARITRKIPVMAEFLFTRVIFVDSAKVCPDPYNA